MPCDYRILQSPTKGQVKLVLWETVGQSPNTKLIYLEILSDNLTIKFLYTHSLLMTLSTRNQNNKVYTPSTTNTTDFRA